MENHFSTINHVFQHLLDLLPDDPYGNLFWTDGREILTEDYNAHGALVTFFDECGLGICTGFYDPKEDEKDDCVNDHTGMFYITNE